MGDSVHYISATDAKNRFGELLEEARKGPVHVQKNGRDVAVVISPEEYARYQEALKKSGVNPLIARLHEESHARWGKVYEALAK
jgi:prevent-host-death family protein